MSLLRTLLAAGLVIPEGPGEARAVDLLQARPVPVDHVYLGVVGVDHPASIVRHEDPLTILVGDGEDFAYKPVICVETHEFLPAVASQPRDLDAPAAAQAGDVRGDARLRDVRRDQHH